MSKWARILLGLGIAVVACGLYAWFFGVQTFFIWETRNVARKEPVVWITPLQLSDLSVSQAPGKRLSYFGYEFEVPWDDIDRTKTKVIAPGKVIIAFHSGNAISFWSGPPNELLNTLLGDRKIDRKNLGLLLGDEAVQSDYAFKRAILEITPLKFSLLTAKRLAIRQGVFFTMKTTTMPQGAETGVFSVSTSEFKGFQYGRPQSRPKRLSIELFRDDGHVDIFFGQKLNGSTTISQADINRIVQSVHKLLAEQRGSDPGPGPHR